MNTRPTILGAVVAMTLAACAVEPPIIDEGDGAREGTASAQSELTLITSPVRPITPSFPISTIRTTFDTWMERCGGSSFPAGVVVPRDTWSCPSVPSGSGRYVGMPGWQYIAEGHELGLSDATLLALSPDLTPAMISYAQPFCAYTYEIPAGTPLANNAANPVRLAASRLADLESVVGAAAGPLCLALMNPHPGSTSCPTCWWSIFEIPYKHVYPGP